MAHPSSSPHTHAYGSDSSNRTHSLLDLELPVWQEVLFTFLVMIFLVLVVIAFAVPNPNMILVTGLVIFSVLFGTPGGIVSAGVMMAYTLYFFSTDHSFVSFTQENLMKVVVTAVGVTVVGIFVCSLKTAQDRALRDAKSLASMLSEDNELLERASTIDILTGLRNRFALRRDYPYWAEYNKNLHVMMLDIDNFKDVNDKYGHEQGDRLLEQIGELLLDAFGPTRTYRYGGDEFLVIASDWTDSMFSSACGELSNSVKNMVLGDDDERVRLSGGYVCGSVQYQSDLRLMMRQADDNLYKAKREGKDLIAGGAYDRERAQSLEIDGRAVRWGDRF